VPVDYLLINIIDLSHIQLLSYSIYAVLKVPSICANWLSGYQLAIKS